MPPHRHRRLPQGPGGARTAASARARAPATPRGTTQLPVAAEGRKPLGGTACREGEVARPGHARPRPRHRPFLSWPLPGYASAARRRGPAPPGAEGPAGRRGTARGRRPPSPPPSPEPAAGDTAEVPAFHRFPCLTPPWGSAGQQHAFYQKHLKTFPGPRFVAAGAASG